MGALPPSARACTPLSGFGELSYQVPCTSQVGMARGTSHLLLAVPQREQVLTGSVEMSPPAGRQWIEAGSAGSGSQVVMSAEWPGIARHSKGRGPKWSCRDHTTCSFQGTQLQLDQAFYRKEMGAEL